MKRALSMTAILVSATTACGTIRVFVTSSSDPYGLENNANAFLPTVSTVYANGDNVNAYDYQDYYGNPGPLRPGTFPAVDAPSGTEADPILIEPGSFAYVWLQFQNEAEGERVHALWMNIGEWGTWVPAAVTPTWYLCNNMGGPPGETGKRWDGTATPPDYPEWHHNSWPLLAITADGIVNSPGDLDRNLYDGERRMALLGAIQAPADGKTYSFWFDIESPYRGGYFLFVPEPGAWLLLALAGAGLRRR